jgi:hypothetical protein
MEPSADALLFDVCCLAAHARRENAAAPTAELVLAAIGSLRREREGLPEPPDIILQLAAAAVDLYPAVGSSSTRQSIFYMARENLPDELHDLPFKLDSATHAQLLDVLTLLEQSFGGRSDAATGGQSPPWLDVLARCETLERENSELRRQVTAASADHGVRDVLRANRELVTALYRAVAVADAAKVSESTAATRVALSRSDAATSCSTIDPTVTHSALASSDRATLMHRIELLEQQTKASLADATRRAFEAEQRIVEMQTRALSKVAASKAAGTIVDIATQTETTAKETVSECSTTNSLRESRGVTPPDQRTRDELLFDLVCAQDFYQRSKAEWESDRRALCSKLLLLTESMKASSMAALGVVRVPAVTKNQQPSLVPSLRLPTSSVGQRNSRRL